MSVGEWASIVHHFLLEMYLQYVYRNLYDTISICTNFPRHIVMAVVLRFDKNTTKPPEPSIAVSAAQVSGVT